MAKKEVEPIGEACQKVIDELLKTAPAKWTSQICAGVCLDRITGGHSSGGRYERGSALNGDVCHYWTRPAKDVGIVFNTTKDITSDAQKAFAKWVAQDSPFAYGVLNRDNLEQIYHGGMVIDCSIVGEGGAFWLCKAMRYIYERPYAVEMFGRLVKYGLPPKAAFFVCSSYGQSYGVQEMKAGKLSSYQDHCQVQTNISQDKFVAAYKIDKAKPQWGSRDTSTALGAGELTGCGEDWLGFGGSKKVKVEDGWGGFTEKNVPVNEEKAVASLLQFMKEKGLI